MAIAIDMTPNTMPRIDPLEADEDATVKLMIEAQIARGIRRGEFEPYIHSDEDKDEG